MTVTLIADKISPQVLASAGTITFTANAAGGSGSYEYRFYLKDNITNAWSLVRDYNTTNTWAWTPGAAASYTIQVQARNVGSTAAYEVNTGLTFVITN